MKLRQTVLSVFYPLLIWFNNLITRKSNVLKNEKDIPPITPLYDLSIELNNGELLKLNALRGKKILLVNTASDCGYTRQYEELQGLYESHKEQLAVIGFPANDFRQQEKGDDASIAAFCKLNFGVSFPLAKKSSVVKGPVQNNIFRWLSDSKQNGWCNQQPTWNFSKYVVDEEGKLMYYFDPAVSPLGEEVGKAVSY